MIEKLREKNAPSPVFMPLIERMYSFDKKFVLLEQNMTMPAIKHKRVIMPIRIILPLQEHKLSLKDNLTRLKMA